VQSFQWADYTVKAGMRYTYRVTPMYGTPKNLVPNDAAGVKISVTTEAESGSASGGSAVRHDIYFNRGVIGSQAYARRFQNEAPDPEQPGSPPMKWLSRGLYEALIAFIGRARNERYGLRAVFYEFHYLPVARALRQAVDAGADVKIVYDAESSAKEENVRTMQGGTAAIGHRYPTHRHRRHPAQQVHRAARGWRSHRGVDRVHQHHRGRDLRTSQRRPHHLGCWDRLGVSRLLGASGAEPDADEAARPNRQETPTPAGKPPENSAVPLFSARDEKDSITTLKWYADRMAEAQRLVCFTVAFSLDEVFQEVISAENDVLRYIVKDDDLGDGETIGHDRDVLFAGGGRLEEGALKNFLGERGNPLNRNDYIHTKFMLVDPLGKDPLVVGGSANFSRPSQRTNDENMLVIRGDARVADIYLGEFMRIFDHHYARYVVRRLQEEGQSDPSAGYLKDTAEAWVRPHFDPKSYKAKRRRYFTEN